MRARAADERELPRRELRPALHVVAGAALVRYPETVHTGLVLAPPVARELGVLRKYAAVDRVELVHLLEVCSPHALF